MPQRSLSETMVCRQNGPVNCPIAMLEASGQHVRKQTNPKQAVDICGRLNQDPPQLQDVLGPQLDWCTGLSICPFHLCMGSSSWGTRSGSPESTEGLQVTRRETSPAMLASGEVPRSPTDFRVPLTSACRPKQISCSQEGHA